MGKVKSAIITALLLAAIVVLSLFAVISCDVPGSNHVKRYNSFLSGIHLGADLSGEAYALLYPEGVMSVTDYNLVAEDEGNEDREEYTEKFTKVGGVYVDKDKLADETFKASVAKDAKIISERLGQKGYSSYSVTVEDGYVIKMTVPTNFTYAAYKEYDYTSRSEALSLISTAVQLAMLDGDISLRDNENYESSSSLVSIKDDFAAFFSGVRYYAMGGTYAVQMDLTKDGFDKINNILLLGDSNSKAYFFIGDTNLNIQLDMGKPLEGRTLYFSSDVDRAQSLAAVLGSVIGGNILTNEYNEHPEVSGTELIVSTPEMGQYAALYLLGILALALVAAIVVPIVKYKKLGLVNAIMALIYANVIILSLLLLGIQLTISGAFMAVLGLALLTFTNVRVFEAVRKETATGRTIQASVKTGYKKTLLSLIDLYVILIVASALVALVCVGELAACGFIFFIGTLASYVLYWFTRLMWFVISSPVKDKFAFCGFKREVYDDEI